LSTLGGFRVRTGTYKEHFHCTGFTSSKGLEKRLTSSTKAGFEMWFEKKLASSEQVD
jgi:hypothetical protein